MSVNVAIQLNQDIPPIPLTIEEPLSVGEVLDKLEEHLRGNLDEETDSWVGQSPNYSLVEQIRSDLKGGHRKPQVNGYQVDLGTPQAVGDGDLVFFQGKSVQA